MLHSCFLKTILDIHLYLKQEFYTHYFSYYYQTNQTKEYLELEIMNSSENLSLSDSFMDEDEDDGIEMVLQFWIEGVLTPVVGLFGVLGMCSTIHHFVNWLQ